MPDNTLREDIYDHMYALWASELDSGEFEYRVRRVQALIQDAVNEARIDEYDKLYKRVWAIFEGLDDAGAQTAKLKHAFRVNREFRINKLNEGHWLKGRESYGNKSDLYFCHCGFASHNEQEVEDHIKWKLAELTKGEADANR